MKTTKQDLTTLAAIIKEHNLSAVEYKDAEFSLRLEKGGAVTSPLTKSNEEFSEIAEVNVEDNLEEIIHDEQVETDYFKVTSPIVGNFYTAKKPGEAPFVKVGDQVNEGQVIAIIEAMKVMNEIKSPVSGVIKKINFDDGEFVDTLSQLMEIEEM